VREVPGLSKVPSSSGPSSPEKYSSFLMPSGYRKTICFAGRSLTSGFEDKDEYGEFVE
jgi:hypothetical protein